jgi:hypothetical protein
MLTPLPVDTVISVQTLKAETTVAAEWLVDVVAAAPLSQAVKAAGRELMAQYNFTSNLDARCSGLNRGLPLEACYWDSQCCVTSSVR